MSSYTKFKTVYKTRSAVKSSMERKISVDMEEVVISKIYLEKVDSSGYALPYTYQLILKV